MSALSSFRFLRPYVQRQHDLSASKRAAYLYFYSATRRLSKSATARTVDTVQRLEDQDVEKKLLGDRWEDEKATTSAPAQVLDHLRREECREDVKRRANELQAAQALEYPRIRHDRRAMTCSEFRTRYSALKPEQSKPDDIVTLRGRVYSSRIAGSKLIFIDIVQDGYKVQGLCNLRNLEPFSVNTEQFREFYHILRRGDIISITGIPCRTKRGELTMTSTELPLILTPGLASIPTTLDDLETRVRNRHADLLVNQRTLDTLKLRSHIVQHLRNFLVLENFLEVQTPILADGVGGAAARPFMTRATGFMNKELSLRIAPEIWLKRLVLGGMDRVFEIGPAFRNEGIDATHNPEFTSCEFYKSFADLEELIFMTERLVSGLTKQVNGLIESRFTSLQILDAKYYTEPFKRIEFIPSLEAAMGFKLPDLAAGDATEQVIALFAALSEKLPASPTLPRLLDRLASIYLEPQCAKPSFIIYHPACLAPLAKSFLDPTTNQLVSARAELYIRNQEIANMYEEENSPFEQRRKFMQQSQWRDDEDCAVIDESYLEALEWGLPPTGGWGCGVDRLCMLFSGANRISDVLTFGSLRNVVGLGQG